jgi:predicted nucleic acid-binding protein
LSCAIDTNALVDLVAGEEAVALKIASSLEEQGAKGALVIAAPVYAECLAHPRWTPRTLDQFLAETSLNVDWNLEKIVWVRAGERFGAYARHREKSGSGQPRRILADFVIGAHAELLGALLTRDLGFYKTYYPKLDLITV